ncbi:hypothetical protein [Tsukamurella tyrosinosolvens]|uniref:hypothetical protein n=1 Tax=Tsukamurella tyrosinosolvens TaxID=57704 RepID=UPI000DF71A60|nr:hypothetical protein [Tsukamurella tyrosinosolvens]RDB44939.1 hypothetical protein DVB87_25975 [Tsukamurella tyrosinosolvens]
MTDTFTPFPTPLVAVVKTSLRHLHGLDGRCPQQGQDCTGEFATNIWTPYTVIGVLHLNPNRPEELATVNEHGKVHTLTAVVDETLWDWWEVEGVYPFGHVPTGYSVQVRDRLGASDLEAIREEVRAKIMADA